MFVGAVRYGRRTGSKDDDLEAIQGDANLADMHMGQKVCLGQSPGMRDLCSDPV